MESTFSVLAREIAEQRMRARYSEDRLRDLEQILITLGVTLWETDAALRLTGSLGMDIADGYLDCHIGDFYRDVYGLEEPDAAPMAAHMDAQAGHSATFTFAFDRSQYAILVEPKRERSGVIVGTVGMSVRLPPE